jgi:hypothetical protein
MMSLLGTCAVLLSVFNSDRYNSITPRRPHNLFKSSSFFPK